jgi:hypothetical protein
MMRRQQQKQLSHPFLEKRVAVIVTGPSPKTSSILANYSLRIDTPWSQLVTGMETEIQIYSWAAALARSMPTLIKEELRILIGLEWNSLRLHRMVVVSVHLPSLTSMEMETLIF